MRCFFTTQNLMEYHPFISMKAEKWIQFRATVSHYYGYNFPWLCVISSWLPYLPGCTYLTVFLLQCHHNKFLHNKNSSGTLSTWNWERRTREGWKEGGRGACESEAWVAGLAWHGSLFSSPCKVFTISLSVASLSSKWGQRITWRGGKRSRSGKAFVWWMVNLSLSPSQGREVFFLLFCC